MDYYYFLFLLWFPFSIFTCSIKKIIYFWFSKDNITFEYSSLFNDDTWFIAVKNSLIQVPNSLFITGEVYYKSQFMVNIRVILPLVLKDAFYGFIMVFIVSLRELVTAKLLQSTFFYIM